MSHYLTTGSWALGYIHPIILPTIDSARVVPFEFDNQSVPITAGENKVKLLIKYQPLSMHLTETSS